MRILLTLPLLALFGVTLIDASGDPVNDCYFKIGGCRGEPWRKRDTNDVVEKREASEEMKEKRTAQTDPMYDYQVCVNAIRSQGGYSESTIHAICQRRQGPYGKREINRIVKKREASEEVKEKRTAQTDPMYDYQVCMNSVRSGGYYTESQAHAICTRRLGPHGKRATNGAVEKREASLEKGGREPLPSLPCGIMGCRWAHRDKELWHRERRINRTVEKREASEEMKEKRTAQTDPMYDYQVCMNSVRSGGYYSESQAHAICTRRLGPHGKREVNGAVEKREASREKRYDYYCKCDEVTGKCQQCDVLGCFSVFGICKGPTIYE